MNPNDQWPGHLAIEMECAPTEKRYEKSKGERHGLVIVGAGDNNAARSVGCGDADAGGLVGRAPRFLEQHVEPGVLDALNP